MWQELKNQWGQGGMLVRLLLVNGGVFLMVTTLQLLTTLGFGKASPWESGAVLGLATTWVPDVLLRRPWTIITHMFVHTGVWHLLMNMALLYWMGRLFVVHFGSRRLLSTYLVGGLAGFLSISARPICFQDCSKARTPMAQVQPLWPYLLLWQHAILNAG